MFGVRHAVCQDDLVKFLRFTDTEFPPETGVPGSQQVQCL